MARSHLNEKTSRHYPSAIALPLRLSLHPLAIALERKDIAPLSISDRITFKTVSTSISDRTALKRYLYTSPLVPIV
jgi:hypothetical protein